MKETAILYIADGRKADISKAPSRKYKVQHNPSEITVSAGEPMKKSKKNKLYKTGADKAHKTAEYQPEQYSIRVTIPLIFDNSKEYERGALGGGLQDESMLSVQTEVDGFIAMMRNNNLRYMIFSWGVICYEGELTSLSGQYTMFTKSGTPIRASLSLTIKCKDFNNNNQWLEMYFKAFSGGMKRRKMTGGTPGLNKALLKISKVKYNRADKSVKLDESAVYTMEAEYNPSSISISSGASLDTDTGEAYDSVKKEEKKADTQISFQLIFDSAQENETDVACVTNGLLALMTDKTLTKLEFCWGDMSIKGQLSGIQAKFTMFSEEGAPMRAVVDISLNRDDEDDAYWDNVFDKLAGKKYGGI
ncbi:MAG: hypothetical protein K1W00_04650 [Lachnospiraceae bacterium]